MRFLRLVFCVSAVSLFWVSQAEAQHATPQPFHQTVNPPDLTDGWWDSSDPMASDPFQGCTGKCSNPCEDTHCPSVCTGPMGGPACPSCCQSQYSKIVQKCGGGAVCRDIHNPDLNTCLCSCSSNCW